jgi:hypothetical protein
VGDVLLLDPGDRVTIELQGGDRQAFLHNLCTNEIRRLRPGEGCEAFLTNIKGRIVGHILVFAEETSLWIDTVPGCETAVAAHLERYHITEDVEIRPRTAELAAFLVTGGRASDWLSDLTGAVPAVLGAHQRTSIVGCEVMLRRVPLTPDPSFELVVSRAALSTLHRLLQERGAEWATAETWTALRIEAGFPLYGVDITEDCIAQEAGRTGQAISFTKGCYLGQEPIARLDALGHVNRELRRLRLADGPLPAAGALVLSAEQAEVGRISSVAMSRDGRTPVALAMLKSAVTAPGTEVSVSLGDCGTRTPARVEW